MHKVTDLSLYEGIYNVNCNYCLFIYLIIYLLQILGDYNTKRKEFAFSLFDFNSRSAFNRTKIQPVKYETLGNRDTWNADVQVSMLLYSWLGSSYEQTFPDGKAWQLRVWPLSFTHSEIDITYELLLVPVNLII